MTELRRDAAERPLVAEVVRSGGEDARGGGGSGWSGWSGAAEEGIYGGGLSASSNVSGSALSPGSVGEPGEQTSISGGSLMFAEGQCTVCTSATLSRASVVYQSACCRASVSYNLYQMAFR